MRPINVIATAAAILAGGLLISAPASADFNGGGPIKRGKMCWVAMTGMDHGFWRACPKPAKAARKAGKKKMSAKKKK